MQSTDFIEALRSDFSVRLRRNPQYSLRAYAKALKVDQSLLSKILGGKRMPSEKFVSEIGPRIGFAPVPLKSEKDKTFFKLSEDMFTVLSEWYHFAILTLIKIEGAKVQPSRLAKRLGLHLFEIDEALLRLERTGFLKKAKGGFEILQPDASWFSAESTSAARRKFQAQVAEQALQALFDIDFNERDHSSLTIACNPKHMTEIREKIRQFRRSLDQFIESKNDATEVYQLSIAFYPVTKKGTTT